jgi:hypothetical protein
MGGRLALLEQSPDCLIRFVAPDWVITSYIDIDARADFIGVVHAAAGGGHWRWSTAGCGCTWADGCNPTVIDRLHLSHSNWQMAAAGLTADLVDEDLTRRIAAPTRLIRLLHL